MFDLTNNKWSLLDDKGEVPSGRTGHSLIKYKDYIIQFGGILEITKESEDIYVYNIKKKEWKFVDATLGPLNLESTFLSDG